MIPITLYQLENIGISIFQSAKKNGRLGRMHDLHREGLESIPFPLLIQTQTYLLSSARTCTDRLSSSGLGSGLESVSQAALAARLPVLVPSHEHASTTSGGGAYMGQYMAY